MNCYVLYLYPFVCSHVCVYCIFCHVSYIHCQFVFVSVHIGKVMLAKAHRCAFPGKIQNVLCPYLFPSFASCTTQWFNRLVSVIAIHSVRATLSLSLSKTERTHVVHFYVPFVRYCPCFSRMCKIKIYHSYAI